MKKKLKDLLDYEQPTKYIVETENYSDEYETPVLTAGKSFVLGYTNETDGVFKGKKEPVIIFDDFTRDTKYVDFDFKVKSSAMKILHKHNQNDSLKYIHYAIKNIKYTPFSHKRLWISDFSNFEIDYPSKEEQQKISTELDTIQLAIDNRKQQLSLIDEAVRSKFIELFGDPFANPNNWKNDFLGNYFHYANNGMSRRGHNDDGNIVLRLVELQRGKIDYSNVNRITINSKEEKFILKENDILFARVNGNPDNVGRCAFFKDIGEKVYHNDHIIRVHFDEKLLNVYFLTSLLNSDYGKSEFKKYIKTSAGQYTISQEGIASVKIYLPPLNLQNDFAFFCKQIDKEKSIVKQQNADLQELLESKMQQYFGD